MRISVLATAVATAVALLTTGCAEPEVASQGEVAFDLSPEQPGRVHAAKVDAIAAAVPQAIRDRGTLVVTGDSGTAPPLRFYATDDRTIVGTEVDIAALIAEVLGLRLEVRAADWTQNFVQIDSGQVDAFIGNVTVTEERKDKYDFATYRKDNVALEVPNDSDIDYKDRTSLAGKRIGVGSGTNQEQLLVQWNQQNTAQGLPPIDIAYFQHASDYYLALSSHRLDGFIGPNPNAVYHTATAKQTKIIATYSGGGEAVQGEIAAMTKKDNGLIEPIHQALQHVIEDGTYQRLLDRWGLQDEALPKSEVNPVGLPRKQ